VRIPKEPFLNFEKYTSFFWFLVIPDERIADRFSKLGENNDNTAVLKNLACHSQASETEQQVWLTDYVLLHVTLFCAHVRGTRVCFCTISKYGVTNMGLENHWGVVCYVSFLYFLVCHHMRALPHNQISKRLTQI
jgi:hypothetical protein